MSVYPTIFIEELLMAKKTSANVVLRERERKEIEAQVKAFLDRGGHIEQIPLHGKNAKPVGPVWRASYSGSYDSF